MKPLQPPREEEQGSVRPSDHQTQPPTFTLGEYLRSQREQAQATLEQIASETKIGVRILESLENDQYHDLPAKPFLRGFITSYCRFIKINPREVLEQYDQFLDQKTLERPKRDAGHSGYAFDRKDSDHHSRTILLITILAFGLVGGTALFVLKPSLRSHSMTKMEQLQQTYADKAPSENFSPQANPPSLKVIQKEDFSDLAFLGRNATPLDSFPFYLSTKSQGEAPVLSEVKVEAKAEFKPEPKKLIPPTSTILVDQDSNKSPSPMLASDESTGGAAPASTALPVQVPLTSSDSAQENSGVDPDDPLDSGKGLTKKMAKSEIPLPFNFRITKDMWVRYRVDDRPVRTIVIRGENRLVLYGERKVVIQVSDAEAVFFKFKWGPEKALSQDSDVKGIHYFPKDLSQSLKDPFGEVKPFPTSIPARFLPKSE